MVAADRNKQTDILEAYAKSLMNNKKVKNNILKKRECVHSLFLKVYEHMGIDFTLNLV